MELTGKTLVGAGHVITKILIALGGVPRVSYCMLPLYILNSNNGPNMFCLKHVLFQTCYVVEGLQ